MMRVLKVLAGVALAASLVACGGGGAATPNTDATQDTIQRPVKEFTLEHEKIAENAFYDMYEVHLYQFTINYPSVVNLYTHFVVSGTYENNWAYDSGGGTIYGQYARIAQTFDIINEDANVIGIFSQKSNNRGDIQISHSGKYYLRTYFPLTRNDGALKSVFLNNKYDVTLTAFSSTSLLNGTGEDDLLRGDDSNQEINGNIGDDKLYGEGGDDIIAGNVGNDAISGGMGKDILIGGDGIDYFKYYSIDESNRNLSQRDIIRDFQITKDYIDLSNLPSNNNGFNFSGAKYFNGSVPDRNMALALWFVDGVLYGMTNEYNTYFPDYDFAITLEGVTSLPEERIVFPTQ